MSRVAAVEAVIQREARYLDLQRWDDWLNLYTDECEYWVPASPGQTDAKTQVSLFYEDRTLMETRLKRLVHPSALSLAKPIRTSHVVGGITIEDDGARGGEIVATSSFHMLEQHGERQRLFGGLYTHRLQQSDGTLLIRAKRVDLINCDTPFEVIEIFI
ncbi:MAG: aromatic-ring-hydroxylating dioxygenase subunit beta [Bradyrhizobium sp.]